MIKKQGQPISGGAGQFRPTPNVLTRANDTSRDAQKLVRASASPFQNRQGPPNIPIRSMDMSKLGIPYTKPSPVNARPQNMGSKVMSDAQMMAAVGYSANATRSTGSIISGHPTRNVSRTVGSGNQPFAKAKVR